MNAFAGPNAGCLLKSACHAYRRHFSGRHRSDSDMSFRNVRPLHWRLEGPGLTCSVAPAGPGRIGGIYNCMRFSRDRTSRARNQVRSSIGSGLQSNSVMNIVGLKPLIAGSRPETQPRLTTAPMVPAADAQLNSDFRRANSPLVYGPN
jgi:hypothetical protein